MMEAHQNKIKKKKLPLIDTSSQPNKVKGYELYIVFNYYLFTESELWLLTKHDDKCFWKKKRGEREEKR